MPVIPPPPDEPHPDDMMRVEVEIPESYGGNKLMMIVFKTATIGQLKTSVLTELRIRRPKDILLKNMSVEQFSFGSAVEDSSGSSDSPRSSTSGGISALGVPSVGSSRSLSISFSGPRRHRATSEGSPSRTSNDKPKVQRSVTPGRGPGKVGLFARTASFRTSTALTKLRKKDVKQVSFGEEVEVRLLQRKSVGTESATDEVEEPPDDMPLVELLGTDTGGHLYFLPQFEKHELGMSNTGVLQKQGKYWNSWKTCMFQLEEGRLSYYKKRKKASNLNSRKWATLSSCCNAALAHNEVCADCWGNEPYGEFHLFGATVGAEAQSPGAHDYLFNITPAKGSRKFLLRAKSIEDRAEWIKACYKNGAAHHMADALRRNAKNGMESTGAHSFYVKTTSPQIQHESVFSQVYAKYVPFVVRQRFASEGNHEPLKHPEIERFQGLVAFVDISGFTKLSEKLVKEHGQEGAELLNDYISGYFNQLIGTIVQYNGDIIKFAGDAMLVLWRGESASSSHSLDSPRRRRQQYITGINALALRATACCQTLINEFNGFTPEGMSPKDVYLTLHCGIGVGELCSIYVGGVAGKWEYYLAGEPIHQMAQTVDEASSGEVAVSADCAKLIQSVARGKTLPSGTLKISKLTRIPRMSRRRPPYITKDMQEAIKCFVPETVMRMPKKSVSWLAEFREVTIMFVALEKIDYGNADVLANLQKYVVAVQHSTNKFKGIVARLLADDKGTRFKIAFGMPGANRGVAANVCVRAIRCALEIGSSLRRLHCRPSIGIATGTVFCGDAGSKVRCEYTAVGFKVVMAARLMQAAGSGGTLCDRDTYDKSKHALTFEPRPPIRLKGVAAPVDIYMPLSLSTKGQEKTKAMLGLAEERGFRYRLHAKGKYEAAAIGRMSHAHLPGLPCQNTGENPAKATKRMQIVGRDREIRALQDILTEVMDFKKARCFIIQGESFMGKTSLIKDFLESLDSTIVPMAITHVEHQEDLDVSPEKVLQRFVGIDASVAGWDRGTSRIVYSGANAARHSVRFKRGMTVSDSQKYKRDMQEGVGVWVNIMRQVFDSMAAANIALGEEQEKTDALELAGEDSEKYLLMAMTEQRETTRVKPGKGTLWLTEWLSNWGGDGPKCVCIFGLQRLKEPALRLLKHMILSVPCLLVIATTRPFTTLHRPDTYTELVSLAETTATELGAFNLHEATLVAAARLERQNIREAPEALLNYVALKSQGHPVLMDNVIKILLNEGVERKKLFFQDIFTRDELIRAATGAMGWSSADSPEQDKWRTILLEKTLNKHKLFPPSNARTKSRDSPEVSLAGATFAPSFARMGASLADRQSTAPRSRAVSQESDVGDFHSNRDVPRQLAREKQLELDGLKGMKELHMRARHDLIGRVDLLPHDHLFVLKLAAVIGTEFDIGLLSYLYDDETGPMDMDDYGEDDDDEDYDERKIKVSEMCVELVKVDILVRVGNNLDEPFKRSHQLVGLGRIHELEDDDDDDEPGTNDDSPDVFRFKYGYFRDCIFAMLPLEHRRRVQRRIKVHVRPELLDRRAGLEDECRKLRERLDIVNQELEVLDMKLDDMDNLVDDQGYNSDEVELIEI